MGTEAKKERSNLMTAVDIKNYYYACSAKEGISVGAVADRVARCSEEFAEHVENMKGDAYRRKFVRLVTEGRRMAKMRLRK